LYYQITNTLYQEAYLLDHRQYKEWLLLLTDDITYRMPVRQTVERKDGDGLVEDMSFFEETKTSLTARVQRLYAKTAWVEDPPPRQRHSISNIVIHPSSNPDEYKVRSYFNFQRSIGSYVETEVLFGEREDILRKVDGDWKIASRTIYPDQTILGVRNLSMFL
jgi:3-phenylpropionate/cinnamic acid dioxygenase small subunit